MGSTAVGGGCREGRISGGATEEIGAGVEPPGIGEPPAWLNVGVRLAALPGRLTGVAPRAVSWATAVFPAERVSLAIIVPDTDVAMRSSSRLGWGGISPIRPQPAAESEKTARLAASNNPGRGRTVMIPLAAFLIPQFYLIMAR